MSQKKKVIWYCHHYAGSPSLGMSFRPYYLVKEFCDAGYNAFVIAASDHHLKSDPYRQKKAVELRTIDQVNFINLKTPSYKKNGFFRIVNMLKYASSFIVRSNEIIAHTGKPDVIIVSSAHPFHYVPLERLAKRYGAKIIFEVRDLWPLSLIKLLHMPRWNPLIFILGMIEKRAYRNSHHVVSLLNNALPYMESKGLEKTKYKVIPNGVSTELFTVSNKQQLPHSIQKKVNDLKERGYFLVGYTGALGKPNAMDYLIEAINIIQSQNKLIHCFIVGKGVLKKKLEQDAANIQNITFIPPIRKDEIPLFLKQIDLLYIGWNDSDLYQYGISPNKIFDYMMSGRPILESCNKMASIVDVFGCGKYCEPANPDAIANAIIEMSLMSSDALQEMGKKGREAVKNNFDYKILANKYMEIFGE